MEQRVISRRALFYPMLARLCLLVALLLPCAQALAALPDDPAPSAPAELCSPPQGPIVDAADASTGACPATEVPAPPVPVPVEPSVPVQPAEGLHDVTGTVGAAVSTVLTTLPPLPYVPLSSPAPALPEPTGAVPLLPPPMQPAEADKVAPDWTADVVAVEVRKAPQTSGSGFVCVLTLGAPELPPHLLPEAPMPPTSGNPEQGVGSLPVAVRWYAEPDTNFFPLAAVADHRAGAG